MSSSPTVPTSTTRSSSSCGSPADPVAIIACGALGRDIRHIAKRRGWNVRVHALPAELHNRPALIAPAAERLAVRLRRAGARVVLAYADCGTYGALDGVCARLGLARLPGLHCYDVLAGPDRIRAALAAEPGTYLLTDYLVRSFRRSVLEPLGLVARPELWADYFGHYRRLVWLTQAEAPDPALVAQAEAVAARFGLPLTVVETGTSQLERKLGSLLTEAGTAPEARQASTAPEAREACTAPEARQAGTDAAEAPQ